MLAVILPFLDELDGLLASAVKVTFAEEVPAGIVICP